MKQLLLLLFLCPPLMWGQHPHFTPRLPGAPGAQFGANFPNAAALGAQFFLADADSVPELLLISSQYCKLLRLKDSTGFEEVSSFQVPSRGSLVLSGDVDGDGDQDLILGNDRDLYLNDGQGNFSPGSTPFRADFNAQTQSALLLDLDGDGHLDLVQSGKDGMGLYSAVFFNNGQGQFQGQSNNGLPALSNAALASADFDGDGLPDLVLSGRDSLQQISSQLYLNQGNRQFAPAGISPFGNAHFYRLAIGDWDQNGAWDLATLNQNSPSQLYYNLGRTNASDSLLPGLWQGLGALLSLDVNGDGALDLLITDQDDSRGGYAEVLLNQGQGQLRPDPQYTAIGPYTGQALAAANLFGDHLPELFIAGAYDQNGNWSGFARNALFANRQGQWHYLEQDYWPLMYWDTFQLGDLEGDGDLDLVLMGADIINNDAILQGYRNDGKGNFQLDSALFRPLTYPYNQSWWSRQFRNPASGNEHDLLNLFDFDGDEDLDLLVGGVGNAYYFEFAQNQFRLVECALFTELSPFGLRVTNDVAIARLEGDSLAQVFFHDWSGTNNPWFYRYTGGWPPHPQDLDCYFNYILPSYSLGVGHCRFADLDGDGYQDAVQSTRGVFRHTGQIHPHFKNTFAFHGHLRGNSTPRFDRSHFSDLDGDGDLDLISLQQNTLNLYRNNGNAQFQWIQNQDFPYSTLGPIATADFNLDCRGDIVAGNRILYLDTALNLAASQAYLPPFGEETDLAVGDVDQDQDPDIAIIGYRSTGTGDQYFSHLLINDLDLSDTQTVVSIGPYLWPRDSQSYSQSGYYLDSLGQLCPARPGLQLQVYPAPSLPDSLRFCAGDSLPIDASQTWPARYDWSNGDSLAQTYARDTGWLLLTVLDSNQLAQAWRDSVYVQHWPSYRDTFRQSACDSFPWRGSTLWQSGTYYDTLLSSRGCDSVLQLDLIVSPSYLQTSTASACDSFPWRGSTLRQSGTYYDTLLSSQGCDSVLQLDLIVSPSYLQTSTASACDSFPWRGSTLRQSGTYYDTLLSSRGCDSVLQLDLIVSPSYLQTSTASACDSFPWRGSTLRQSGLYYDTLLSSQGCDSVLRLQLNIYPTVFGLQTAVACDQYSWRGRALQQSGVYLDTLDSRFGCDSVVFLNLTIHRSVVRTEQRRACDSLLWGGQIYRSSGIYRDTATTGEGCDSVIVLNVQIDSLYRKVLSTGYSAVSLQNSGTYQWFSCDWQRPVSGANQQLFTPDSSGHYAVILQSGACRDTSACLFLQVISQTEREIAKLRVYPNPSKGKFHIHFPYTSRYRLKLYGGDGRLFHEELVKGSHCELDQSGLPKGSYFLWLSDEDRPARWSKKLLIE